MGSFRAMLCMALVALLAPAAADAAPSDFVGDFDTGWWWQYDAFEAHQATTPAGIEQQLQFRSANPRPRQGRYCAEFTVHPGDRFLHSTGERAELQLAQGRNASRERDGDTYWYAWSTLFPHDWVGTAGWGYLLEWHSDFPIPPPVALNAHANDLRLDLHTGQVNDAGAWALNRNVPVLTSLARGVWHDFVVRIHWSTSDGQISIWHRLAGQRTFTQVASVAGIPTLQWKAGHVSTNYLEIGLYRAPDPFRTATVYHDGFRRGLRLADVLPAFPDAASLEREGITAAGVRPAHRHRARRRHTRARARRR